MTAGAAATNDRTRKLTRAQLEVALLERIARNAAPKKPKAAPRPKGSAPKPRLRIEARAKHGRLRQDPKATFMKHVRIVDGHWLWGGGPKYKMYESDDTRLAQYRTPAAHALRLFGTWSGTLPVRLVAVCGMEGCIHPAHTRPTGHPDLVFWPRVEKVLDAEGGGCWLWKGIIDRFGYPRLNYDNRQVLAHRFSYALHIGKLNEAREVVQICGHRNCVRPEHLCLGDRRRGRRRAAALEVSVSETSSASAP